MVVRLLARLLAQRTLQTSLHFINNSNEATDLITREKGYILEGVDCEGRRKAMRTVAAAQELLEQMGMERCPCAL